MNTLSKLGLTAAFGLFLLSAAPAQAQITVNITPPSWGPAVPAGAQYYYIPDVEGYYDLRAQRYILLRNNQWVRVANPAGYDPRQFHPVVIDYVGAQPWTLIGRHRAQYALPPGQVKRLQSGKGLPPGQAKKLYGGGPGKGHGNGRGHGKH